MESWWPVARRGELVGYLTDDEHARLLAVAESCSAAAGDLVFQKGGPSRSLLIVESPSKAKTLNLSSNLPERRAEDYGSVSESKPSARSGAD